MPPELPPSSSARPLHAHRAAMNELAPVHQVTMSLLGVPALAVAVGRGQARGSPDPLAAAAAGGDLAAPTLLPATVPAGQPPTTAVAVGKAAGKETATERKARQQRNNSEAQKRYRSRQKEKLTNLVNLSERLTKENRGLQKHVAALEREVARLGAELAAAKGMPKGMHGEPGTPSATSSDAAPDTPPAHQTAGQARGAFGAPPASA